MLIRRSENMVGQMSEFNKYENAILKFVFSLDKEYFSINEIAKGTGIGWNTVKKYVSVLTERGWFD